MALVSSMILVSDGTLQTIHLTFPFRVKEDIRVYVRGGEVLVNDGWVWSGVNTIRFDTPIPNDVTVWVRRLTDLSGVPHIFGEVSGATGRSEFTYVTVDENFEYILEASQDALDSFEFSRGSVESTREWAELAVENAELALQYANAAETSKQLSEAARLASEAAKVVASNSASQAAASATNASNSATTTANLRDEVNTLLQQIQALKADTEASASAALDSQNAAKTSETNTKASEVAVKASQTAAANSASSASSSASVASSAANTAQGAAYTATAKAFEASNSANAASNSETNASDSAALAKDWAIKLDGTVDGVDYSAKYWAMEAENTVTSGTLVVTEDSPSISFTGVGSSGDPLTAGVIFGTTSGTAAQGDDSRITGAVQTSANLSDLTDVTTARSNLGLRDAATRDVGTSNGQLMEVGAFGLGHSSISKSYPSEPFSGAQVVHYMNPGVPGPLGVGYADRTSYLEMSTSNHKTTITSDGESLYFSWVYNRVPVASDFKRLWDSSKTTVDSNGFIKVASPIVKLFSDRIEKTEHLEIAEAELERLGVGHYVLHNAPPLSRDGWYIETPKDRNGNIYFYLDYDEDEDNKTLTIKTYEPDYSSGRAEAGEPVDILEGRFVTLRFSEDPSLYESMVVLEDES